MKKGSFQWMKSLNRSIILNKVRTDGPISRATIAKETKLTPPTVSNLVSELIVSGLVIESEQGESIGGRKPTLLVINNTRFHIIGLDVGTKSIRAVLVNLSGTVLGEKETPIPLAITKDSLLKLIKQTITSLAHTHEDKEIIGIGVGMHGVVDVESGVSLFAPGLNLRDTPIKEFLEAELDLHVIIDNDVRAMAFGEYWFENGKNVDNMVTINIGHGVGAGIVLNGRLFYGDHDLAGEIGHMTVDLNGRLCSCGNHGCWETLISGPAIGRTALSYLEAGAKTMLGKKPLDGQAVYNAALQGDEVAKQVLEITGQYIGIGLTNLIHLLNPTKIIIGGGVSGASRFIMPKIRETIAERGLTKQAKETEIYCSEQGAFGTARGAAALVLGEIFEGDFPVKEM
ncbi:ROK family transcriptional regulator [Bacillus niameyensis]|uniref:ROK family transcriptional regulator n=1 Tax=Bacillus niameyensis TaxID=1522308 RepID=UPI000783A3EF|nr:ROK family transcriptional regulator [Bacillus niameyensis]